MLFGNDNIRRKIIEDVKKYAEGFNGCVIYGAVCGSISKGFQTAQSDYDTRFLYINRDFPEKVYYPKELPETEIIKRCYTDGVSVPYEWIPCWELTSFFQYLVEPYIEGKLSYGLYNTVGWTLQSPYAWDPFGLQQKIIPLMNSIFEKKYALGYYIDYLENLWISTDGMYYPKDYIYGIYTAAQINWVLNNNSFPPVNGMILLYLCAPKFIRDDIESAKTKIIDGGKSKITVSDEVNAYISETLKQAKSITDTSVPKQRKIEVVNAIYHIIYSSVFHESLVNNVNDFRENASCDNAGKWFCFKTVPEKVVYHNGTHEFSAKSENDCRRMRMLLSNSGSESVSVKRITVSNKDLSRIITVNGKETFTISPGSSCYTDDVLAWLCYSEFNVRVELNEKINGEDIGIVKQLEEWIYPQDNITSSITFL